jgi:hypothetical protein
MKFVAKSSKPNYVDVTFPDGTDRKVEVFRNTIANSRHAEDLLGRIKKFKPSKSDFDQTNELLKELVEFLFPSNKFEDFEDWETTDLYEFISLVMSPVKKENEDADLKKNSPSELS